MGMTMTQRVPCWIQGKPAASGSERYTEIRNPATQELIAEVPDGTATDVDQAVACAAAAFEDWRSTPISERARVFLRLQHLVTEHKEDLARMITDEQGKTLEDARGDVFRGLEVIEFACGIANHVMGETVENVARGVDTYSLVQPLGVCAGITPFNFPAMVPLWMWPIAIAAGNTFVLKPSERVPLTSMRIAELARDAGLPDGVLNLVHGGRTVVQRLCTHPLVKALSFVGSAVAGRAIYSMATAEGKRCQALMAAKNHAVILPDADRERALSGIVGAAFGASGQRCMAISVAVFVGESKSWIPGLVQRARSMRVGPGVDPKSDLGPLISPDSKRRICDLIAVGVADGADLLLDGRDCVVEGFETGNFMGPSILSGAP
ncbi:MAG: CoA-acylating methylmalonate-semialdehyde dehydrogenase, partial [Chlamydiia bacterium]|nr:CoA-acylating methylmalonate-semialdehyde dehydrogenase [Chlamydiia bacterium]